MQKVLLFAIPMVIIIAFGIYFGFVQEDNRTTSVTFEVEFYETYENYCDCIDECGCPSGPKLLKKVKVKAGDIVTKIEDPKQEGRELVGWTLTDGSMELYDFNTTVTENIKLYTIWQNDNKEKFKVTFYETYEHYCNCLNCDCPSGPKVFLVVEVSSGNKVSEPDGLESMHQEPIGWTLVEGSNELYDFNTPVTKDIYLYAKYK